MLPERVGAVIRGLADACRANGCALLGGFTYSRTLPAHSGGAGQEVNVVIA